MKMSATTILILLIIGAITGIMAGMLGIGGGLIVIPALVMVMGMSQQSAQGNKPCYDASPNWNISGI